MVPTSSLDSPVLADIVRRLVAAYGPERIYLFGSMARGDAGPDSDYDVLVVVADDTEPGRLASRRGHPASG
jgi:predicted nucleotidyltransferase